MTDVHDDDQEHEPAPGGAADFDAFFAEQQRARKKIRASLTLYGRTYTLPESLPILFTLQAERVRNSSSPADVRRMLAALFGDDVLDEWAAQGMEDRQLGILLIWSAAAVRAPGRMSLERAAELHDAEAAGKAPAPAPAPNRSARRAKKKGKKGRSSGRRS